MPSRSFCPRRWASNRGVASTISSTAVRPCAFNQRDQPCGSARFGEQSIQDLQVRGRFCLRQDPIIGTGPAFQERLEVGKVATPIQAICSHARLEGPAAGCAR